MILGLSKSIFYFQNLFVDWLWEKRGKENLRMLLRLFAWKTKGRLELLGGMGKWKKAEVGLI